MSYANKSNDYLLDYEVQKKYMMSGVPFLVNLQDRAMTETMGAIYDRRREHLGTSDRMIIQVRKQLLAGARSHMEDGTVPRASTTPSWCASAPSGPS